MTVTAAGTTNRAATEGGVRALLADGRVVRITMLDQSDLDAVLDLHTRLSERDRYLRFFGTGTRVLDAVSRRITRAPDFRHAALVVDGTLQAHGLGTLLLEHLASVARHRGATRFVAEVLAENGRMLQVFADAGLRYEMSTTGPERRVEISLTTDERFAACLEVLLADTDLIADRIALLTPLSDVDAERMVHGLRASAALFDGTDPLPTAGLIDVLTRA